MSVRKNWNKQKMFRGKAKKTRKGIARVWKVWSLKECVKERGIVEWGKRKTGKEVKWKSLTREREAQ
jgi:hypothetical protein